PRPPGSIPEVNDKAIPDRAGRPDPRLPAEQLARRAPRPRRKLLHRHPRGCWHVDPCLLPALRIRRIIPQPHKRPRRPLLRQLPGEAVMQDHVPLLQKLLDLLIREKLVLPPHRHPSHPPSIRFARLLPSPPTPACPL